MPFRKELSTDIDLCFFTMTICRVGDMSQCLGGLFCHAEDPGLTPHIITTVYNSV